MTTVYIKTEEEIEGFKQAGKEAARILRVVIDHAQPGWKPTELDDMAQEECAKINAKPAFLGYRGFPSSICFSKDNTMVHGIPDTEPLKEEDLVSVDFGLDIDGFIGDTAETIIIGFPHKKAIGFPHRNKQHCKLISECNFALFRAIKAAKVGNKLSDVSKEIKKVADANKFLIPKDYGGHGINRGKLHASPFIPNQPDYENDFTLRKGMILAIEPMFIDSSSNRVRIANDGWSVVADGPTAHCEHTVLVDEHEGVALTDGRGQLVRREV